MFPLNTVRYSMRARGLYALLRITRIYYSTQYAPQLTCHSTDLSITIRPIELSIAHTIKVRDIAHGHSIERKTRPLVLFVRSKLALDCVETRLRCNYSIAHSPRYTNSSTRSTTILTYAYTASTVTAMIRWYTRGPKRNTRDDYGNEHDDDTRAHLRHIALCSPWQNAPADVHLRSGPFNSASMPSAALTLAQSTVARPFGDKATPAPN